MNLTRSSCPLDCPDTCVLDVTSQEGRLVQISGSREHPYTAGYICRKVRHFGEHQDGDDRVRTPLRRTGPKGSGQFEPISWDKALETVVQQIQRTVEIASGEAILPFCYGGSNGKLTQDTVDARLFRRLGASQLARTVCAAPTGRAFTGLYGRMPGVAFHDYQHARLIVVWGANPHASGIHLVPILQKAQQQGAYLVVVDPRRTSLAKQANLHLAVRPGSDAAVALAVIRYLFEEGRADEAFLEQWADEVDELRRRAEPWTFEAAAQYADIPEADLRELALVYSDLSPAVIRVGYGLERNRQGGSAAAAVMALPAVAGKFGVRGGGFTMSNSRCWSLNQEAAIGEPGVATRVVNMNQLGRKLVDPDLDPRIRLLFVYNANPLATLPNQQAVREGLLREDLFTVVHDQVLTDTARFADIVLPATTFLEHTDYRVAYGTGYLSRVTPALPAGEARPNYAVFDDLIARLGLQKPGDVSQPEQLLERLLGDQWTPELREQLDRDGFVPPPSGIAPIQFQDVFPGTADGRIHLVPQDLDAEAPRGLYRLHRRVGGDGQDGGDEQGGASNETPPRLQLISPASAKSISSTLSQLDPQPATLELAPADAVLRNIEDGDTVRISNAWGEVVCRARVSDEMRRGVASLRKGLWGRQSVNGFTANALAPDHLADLGGGACFNDAEVEVERLPSEVAPRSESFPT